MALFQSFGISASGMTAQQFRADIIAENLANVNTTRTDNGTTYRRKVVSFQEKGVNRFDRYLRSEEHTSELQSLTRISYDVLCL